MSQKIRFYLLYKNAVLLIFNSFNKVWDRSNTQVKKLFCSVCWGWGVSFIWKISQEITFTWRFWRQARITSYFNLKFNLSALHAAVIHGNGKKFPWGKKILIDNPKFSLLKPMPIKKFQLKRTDKSPDFPLSYHPRALLVQFWFNQNEHISLKTIFTAPSMPLLMHEIVSLNTPTKLISLCPQIILPSITARICLKIRKISWRTLGQMKKNWCVKLKIHCYK